MRIDPSHRPWIVATLIVGALTAAAYFMAARDPLHPISGGSALGLLFGSAGTACMVFAAALTLRKQLKNWRLGKVSRWLSGHIWLGVLALPLILFHGGFRLGGPLTTALMALLVASWVSGLVGLVLQHVVPRLMTEQAPRETIYEQIDHVVELLRGEARTLIESVCGSLAPEPVAALPATAPAVGARPAAVKAPQPGSDPLKEFYSGQARPFLESNRPRSTLFDRPTSAQVQRAHLKRLVPAALHESIDDLFEICEERRQIERQRRLHLWLHGWLFVHVPVSWALLAATAFHAVRALRY